MEYKLKNQQLVSNFQILGNNVAWLQGDYLIYNNDLLFKAYNYVLLSNIIAYSLKENEIENIYIYNVKDQSSKLIFENGGLGYKLFGKDLLSISCRKLKSKIIFDVNKNETIFKSNHSINSVYYSKVYFKTKTTLRSLSLLTGEYEWEVDLGEYGEIKKIIGVHEGKLWVSCQFTIVAVSTLSGEVLHIFKEPTHIAYQDGDLQYFRGIDAQLDETSGLLYGIEHETYYELDLHTLQFTYWIFTNTSNQLKCNAPHSHCKAYFDNEIFFIDKMNATIGSFNRDLKEWSIEYSFPDRLIIDMPDLEAVTVGFMNDIQVGSNKLYVLTSEGFLFIFEKQETA